MFKLFMIAVYIVMNGYLIWRLTFWTKKIIPLFKHPIAQGTWTVIYLIFAVTIFSPLFISSGPLGHVLHKISNIWLGAMIYLLFFTAIADLIMVIQKLIKKIRGKNTKISAEQIFIAGVIVICLSAGLTLYGTAHMNVIKVNSHTVAVNKSVEGMDRLQVVLVGDLHLGHNIGTSHIQDMADKINKIKPDVVIYAGDIFDNNYDAIEEPEKIIEVLKKIKPKYGSYAVFGNHDVEEVLVGGFSTGPIELALRDQRMESFMEKAGIQMLLDEQTEICDGKITLIGRLDGEKTGDKSNERKSIEALTANVNKEKPLFVINHEPDELHEVAKCGVDIYLSGHTHAGQFFPLTLSSPIAWENPWGVINVDGMYSAVTSGIGVYGPALRVGTDAEIMNIEVRFK